MYFVSSTVEGDKTWVGPFDDYVEADEWRTASRFVGAIGMGWPPNDALVLPPSSFSLEPVQLVAKRRGQGRYSVTDLDGRVWSVERDMEQEDSVWWAEAIDNSESRGPFSGLFEARDRLAGPVLVK